MDQIFSTNHELLLMDWKVTCFYAQNVVARETKHILTIWVPSNTVGIWFLKMNYTQIITVLWW